jgi:dTDP-4-dehydrorhamnose 3,5-epimerase
MRYKHGVIVKKIRSEARETIHETYISGLVIVEAPTYGDKRGFFRETYRKKDLEAVLGRRINFEQGNHSRNEAYNTLRGFHIAPWDKFIYVPRGRVQVVIADTRIESPTFGKLFVLELGDSLDPSKPEDARRARIWIPARCANGYLVLSQEADYMYDTTAEWFPGSEKEIRWDDKDLGVKWANTEPPILSERDAEAPSLRQLFPEKFQ